MNGTVKFIEHRTELLHVLSSAPDIGRGTWMWVAKNEKLKDPERSKWYIRTFAVRGCPEAVDVHCCCKTMNVVYTSTPAGLQSHVDDIRILTLRRRIIQNGTDRSTRKHVYVGQCDACDTIYAVEATLIPKAS